MNYLKRLLPVFVVLVSLLSSTLDAKKKRPAPVVSPILQEDGKVTFQVKAPSAEEVFVSGEMAKGKFAMEKGEGGVWSVTLEDVKAGLYGYSLIIDGVRQLDPGNPNLKPMRSPKTSILHIPGGHLYDFRKEIPHGTVHQHSYYSEPINRLREMRIYTPPGYETSYAKYPLLVLQHGHSDSFATWTTYGKAHWILDNLIADGNAKPMIVVMLDGHPIPSSYGNGRSIDNTEELRQDLMDVVLPMLEKKYRVKPGRENRAITGLSMGGLHSLSIGLTEMESFGSVGAFSAAVPKLDQCASVLKQAAKPENQFDLLWIACGKEDFLLNENLLFVESLKENNVPHTWLLTEGNHSWPIWRGYLADFVPLLFQ